MGDGDQIPPVKSYPPPVVAVLPPPRPPKVLSLVTAGAAATAGFLGYCEAAGILALLSLVFGLWDFFQTRDIIKLPLDKIEDLGGSEQISTQTSAGPKTRDRGDTPPSYS